MKFWETKILELDRVVNKSNKYFIVLMLYFIVLMFTGYFIP